MLGLKHSHGPKGTSIPFGSRCLVLVLGLLVACGLVACRSEPESATWHQRLTVAIDTPHGPRTGSAITEIVLDADAPALTGEMGDGRQIWRGEAVLIDIGGGDAAWSAPRWLVVAPESPWFLARRLGGKYDKFGEWTAKVRAAEGGEPIEVHMHALRFYALSDVTWARAIEPRGENREIDTVAPVIEMIGGLEGVFGPDVAWRSATLEIVDGETANRGKSDEPIRDLLGPWLGRPGDPPPVPLAVLRDDQPVAPIGPETFVSPDRLPTPVWVTNEEAYRKSL